MINKLHNWNKGSSAHQMASCKSPSTCAWGFVKIPVQYPDVPLLFSASIQMWRLKRVLGRWWGRSSGLGTPSLGSTSGEQTILKRWDFFENHHNLSSLPFKSTMKIDMWQRWRVLGILARFLLNTAEFFCSFVDPNVWSFTSSVFRSFKTLHNAHCTVFSPSTEGGQTYPKIGHMFYHST